VLRHLRLRESTSFAEAPDVPGEASGNVIHANDVAALQWVVMDAIRRDRAIHAGDMEVAGVSKAAQDHLARTFAAELDPVRFSAVDPGEMDTKMHADALPDADRTTLARPADVAARLVGLITKAETLTNGARLLAADFAPYPGAGALR
jgi:NAD(P)-dependent dehydrogenase (short-subunit alcohol dehydrogenase family)